MAATKRVLLCGLAAFALTGAASAADLKGPVYTKAPPSAFSWEGQYIGIHGGYAWATNETALGAIGPGDISLTGAYGGVQVGYNYHLSRNWVLGYEVDFSFGDINGSAVIGGLPVPSQTDYFGTARTRLGYANGPWLIYGTAGLAWANNDMPVAPGVINFDRWHVGYAVGAGVEYALAPNWSLKLEYLFADFGDSRVSNGVFNFDSDLSFSTVRVGLNYRFANWKVPSAPTYFTKAPVVNAGWTGPYVGAHVGYGWGSFDNEIPGLASAPLNLRGVFGGVQTGYNWQVSRNWVVGIEADSSWGSIERTIGGETADVDAMGTVRARLGYTMNNVMLYGTGGLAWAHIDSASVATTASRDQFAVGWVAGAGIEYLIAPRWSAKIEYLYSDYGSLYDHPAFAFNAALDSHTVKIGLNYRASLFGLLFDR
ncbi:MAG: porin family protein [Xanthobacteraceae bacterium]|nr:porin family protein [Xanthobacteraceae bacterium]QYK43763.1 MAG: porin family protein [Xanthobacteraceae bacterium]